MSGKGRASVDTLGRNPQSWSQTWARNQVTFPGDLAGQTPPWKQLEAQDGSVPALNRLSVET